jgi:hypothetical protein
MQSRTIGQDVRRVLGKIAGLGQENRAGKAQATRKKQYVIDVDFVPGIQHKS